MANVRDFGRGELHFDHLAVERAGDLLNHHGQETNR